MVRGDVARRVELGDLVPPRSDRPLGLAPVIGSAELWLHHVGDPLRLDIVVPGSPPTSIVLGSDLSVGQRPQVVVPRDAWQAATPLASEQVGYTLVSCTVAPPFRFDAFELAPPGWSPRTP